MEIDFSRKRQLSGVAKADHSFLITPFTFLIVERFEELEITKSNGDPQFFMKLKEAEETTSFNVE